MEPELLASVDISVLIMALDEAGNIELVVSDVKRELLSLGLTFETEKSSLSSLVEYLQPSCTSPPRIYRAATGFMLAMHYTQMITSLKTLAY